MIHRKTILGTEETPLENVFDGAYFSRAPNYELATSLY